MPLVAALAAISASAAALGAPLRLPASASPLLASRAAVLVARGHPLRTGVPQLFNDVPPEPDEDAFQEIVDELTWLQKKVKPLNPFVFGVGVNAATVLTALLAWFATPPIGRVAAAGSLVAGGVGGTKLAKRMREARRGVVPAAIAEMVKFDSIDGLKPKDVAELANRYSVDPVEFEKQLSAVYMRYLRQLLSEDGPPTMAMVKQLGALRRGMGLRWNATEAIHEDEARVFLDGEKPPGGVDDLPVELSALYWLSSTLFATSKLQASADGLQAILGADAAGGQRVVDSVSRPVYRNAVLRAVAKYNRTEAPVVLQTARKALCLSDAVGADVHAAVYDAQLNLLLEGETPALTVDDMELLGELEGMLQARGAAAALRRRTEPLYQEAAASALAAVFAAPADGAPVSVWGRLAVRQQELQLPTEVAKSTVIVESRRLASERLAAAVQHQAAGDETAALAEVAKISEYATFLGELFSVAGLAAEEATPASIAERYLGALSMPPEQREAGQALAAAAAAAQPADASLMSALFAMDDPALEAARAEYRAALEASVSAADFSSDAAAKHAALASRLALPAALAQRLALDTYYEWLLDASERGDQAALESSADVRASLGADPAAVVELYANTGIDELVLSSCCEQMLAEERPLSTGAAQQLSYLEAQLAARPGLASALVLAASD